MGKWSAPFVLLLIFVGTWAGARCLGVVLWRKCLKCASRITRTTKGWILTGGQPDNGFLFVQDTECDCCLHRERQVVPRDQWPAVPAIE